LITSLSSGRAASRPTGFRRELEFKIAYAALATDKHRNELIFDIDECNDDVIFFADEGGSWQIGVDWDRVLPPWFRVLSATATPKEYAEQIDSLLEHHYNYGRDKMLAVARKTATPEQRKALTEAADRQPSRRRERTKP